MLIAALACSGIARAGEAIEPAANPRDTLVFKDGDRVHGKLVERTGDTLVFNSDRFGPMRVPAGDAVIILAEQPAAPVATAAAPPPAHAEKAARAEERAEEERMTIWDRFSPAVLTAAVRNFFGPWHGRLAFSTEVVTDTAQHSAVALDGNLRRKWTADDVQLNARYDYAKSSGLTTTDTVRSSGSWHHDFSKRFFAVYRPSIEWNRAALRAGHHNEYVLLQQEVGAGFSVLAKPGRKLRVGASENFFDVWNYGRPADHNSRVSESLFEEAEWALPWRMSVTQRGVWYPLPHQADAWEHTIELQKKLTETLSAALRQEIRRNNPDGTAQDYTRLRLLVGFDF